jgi:lipopolysaccharide/colanic/teichoic acid biosynthesis glycosyltransferase
MRVKVSVIHVDSHAARGDRFLVRRCLPTQTGIAGLWQVLRRSDLDWEQAVRLDPNHSEHWSLTADLQTVAGTDEVVFTGRGVN